MARFIRYAPDALQTRTAVPHHSSDEIPYVSPYRHSVHNRLRFMRSHTALSLCVMIFGFMAYMTHIFQPYADPETPPPKTKKVESTEPTPQPLGEEVLWLARIAYSEANLRHNMVKVAWAARNRVETCYKGCTYHEVATWADQFSGLQPWHAHYERNMLTVTNLPDNQKWQQAVEVARAVMDAPDVLRPFTKTTRHFYSPVSMKPKYRAPKWAHGHKAIALSRRPGTSNPREILFAFYDGIM